MAFRHATTFIILLDEAIFNVFCICWRIVYFWLSCRLSDASSADQPTNQRHVVQAEEIYSEVWYKCSSSPLRLRRPRAARFIKSGTCKKILFCIIVGLLIFSMGVQKIFIFPEKNLQKIRVHCCFLSDSVSNIFTNLLNFPAKRLRKIRRPKYACANFFKIW